MTDFNFLFNKAHETLKSGSFSWQSPSNIALVKYWGKYGLQLPKNPSISFTLSSSSTKTKLEFTPQKAATKEIEFQIFFEGKEAPDFRPKIQTFFNRIEPYVPFIKEYSFTIYTENTFPHSSGIASSASGMSALALCILQMEKELNPTISTDYFHQKASFLARLGSGSAARSINGPVMIWGKHPNITNSANEFAIQPDFKLHPIFENFQDTILLVDKGQKQVSSTVGHGLMKNHPFAEQRFEQGFENLEKMVSILKKGDLKQFVELVESEALTLHAMMMTSHPYFILMKPNTLKIIEKIWAYRAQNDSAVCFTLDAGANVHLLYPQQEKEEISSFIRKELKPYCKNGEFIKDKIGNGAKPLD